MKTILIFVLISTRGCISLAQQTFFKWYPSDNYTYSYSSVECLDGNFLISGITMIPDNLSPQQGYLVKINQSGDFWLEYIEPNIGDTNNSNTIIFNNPQELNTFFVIGNKHYPGVGIEQGHELVLKKIDENLQTISSSSFPSPPGYIYLPQAYTQTADNMVYILSLVEHFTPALQPVGWAVSKYNLSPDSLKTYTWLSPPYPLLPFGIIHLNDKIKCFDGLMYCPTNVTTLDENLNPISTGVLPRLGSTGTVAKYCDSLYLLTGMVNDLIYVKQHLKVFKINSNDDTLRSLEYYNHPDTVLYGGAINNTAIIGDKIFVVGTYNVNPSLWPWQDTPSWVQITRIDTSMHIIDHHFYGGDAFYMSYNIIATSDGGALVTGNRYDYHTPDIHKYNIFALKINSDGILTDIPENKEWQASEAIVFPNPGNTYLDVVLGFQYSRATLFLFDSDGHLVTEKPLSQSTTRDQTESLTSGAYYYKIVSSNKVIAEGKWIKL